MARLTHNCPGQPAGGPTNLLRAKLAKDVLLKQRENDALVLQCSTCSYNPKVECSCPVCNNQCKALYFFPLDPRAVATGERLLRARQASLQAATTQQQASLRFAAIAPTSNLGRALRTADPRMMNALPMEALQGPQSPHHEPACSPLKLKLQIRQVSDTRAGLLAAKMAFRTPLHAAK